MRSNYALERSVTGLSERAAGARTIVAPAAPSAARSTRTLYFTGVSRVRFIALSILSTILASCANPSVVNVKSDEIARAQVEVVYVPRFEGRPDFVEESTDLFVAELEGRISARVIQGSAIRQEGTDIQAGGNLPDTELATAVAKEAGAQVVILGKVTSHSTGATLNGFSTVRVIDTNSGMTLASFHRPSGLLVGHSEHHAVMAAVKRTAADVASALQ